MNKCPTCQRHIPALWEGRCFPCEAQKDEREGRSVLELSHGEIRFILWAIPQVDLWTDEGMRAFAYMGGQNRLIEKLRNRLPESPTEPK